MWATLVGGFSATMPRPTPARVVALLLAALLGAVVALGLGISTASAATFSNDGDITINTSTNTGAPCGDQTAKATPYPSEIAVSGLDSSISDVNVTVSGLSHTSPDDVALLLVSPTGQSTLLMADSGGFASVSNVNLTFDDAASGFLPNGPFLSSGTYKPSVGASTVGCSPPTSFPDAPPGPYGSSLSVFNGTNPNGTWKLYVIDDSGGDSGTITGWSLTINPPTAVDDNYTTNEDTTLTANGAGSNPTGVLANDTDPDGDTLSAVLVSGPSHSATNGFTLNQDGSFTYTPAANYNGPDSFSYKASDGTEDSNVATVTITVNSVNDAPDAQADSATTAEDTPIANIAVLPNDTDVDGDTLSVSNFDATSAKGGTVSLNADGTLTYTPAANYNGTDSFSYTASDSKGGADMSTVSINVTPVNDAPEVAVAAGGSCATNDRSGTINLTLSDPEGDAMSLTLVSNTNTTLLPNSNVVLGGTGVDRTLTATVLSGKTGMAELTIRVSDGVLTSDLKLTVKADGNGSRTIDGTAGTDLLFGQNGNDVLNGFGSNDLLCGGRGNDTLRGGAGDDTMGGAQGADRFRGGAGEADEATDFAPSQGDTKDEATEAP
jgi:subtilisin-like proprotein convertase family protein